MAVEFAGNIKYQWISMVDFPARELITYNVGPPATIAFSWRT